ncbi:hypothetical protein GLOIN_2v1739595 [Rhizophagus irregularis DAOM 181602=DAOM 197198]|uniref:Uncharacterized protein n=1 Tax=Rhizophagus irregularis (strain DAOM 181602 / DAOM 197198 / MUCL 43194) TaxID=747089 RepID=A0A2P4NSC6_RHIID|nr:hypothetical protein GLOIN_2v1739627 [Rhizophagus irregularis DAOM 181602=DAOM 197198]XP_025164304.1 hypothetical protein GLOIN_2v1739595 [Rhizophagus irregularis DAOM 181602=DAOM 197198]POG56041.1 hypothetical protein GLOIN_2v1739627 [Rhizophagus irregularis DAOM 181602=DAOM 197198]POG56044.1 hypothetical protein GLOIN_2v1739595 [Rhizophagus irregularis DAOM 181602=DAOM 197198]|eukprot:XP_025164301.1 hypothetical protein GLOIN_2v1739627 [Rhizophagus irregularis DAOM 181602=DAOM 197198]
MIRRWVNNYREYNKEPDKSSKTQKSRKHKKSRNSMELESTSYNNHTSDVEESQNNSGDFTSIETLHSDHKNDTEQDDPKLESNNMTTNELQDITQQIEELMNKQKKMLIKARNNKHKVNEVFTLNTSKSIFTIRTRHPKRKFSFV